MSAPCHQFYTSLALNESAGHPDGDDLHRFRLVNVGGVILEETTPIRLEVIPYVKGARFKVLQYRFAVALYFKEIGRVDWQI